MTNFEVNDYIELYDPFKNSYLPVRILELNEDGYNVKSLINKKEFNIYNYQLMEYGFRNTWISEKLLIKLGFVKDKLIYNFENIVIWECLIGELTKIDHPFYLYESRSKHFGYAIFENNKLLEFKIDFKNLIKNSERNEISEKYLLTSSINILFKYLIKYNSNKFSYEAFDNIIIS
ncbi:hypothetical protein [Tenacibaculum finnmarkense]|uniref:hypothetical protein n=1 Tax=Tenacibaculum finnmarkense TaxID=2781243 RepID=UPI001EFAF444|nr:hypothetical protein [Tenacibaculum finnmarkense]MCG8803974.1 hypothetical protein [Tenacibaculum finnmarkense]MCG8826703.1 hypothetical protein [Tenacibaculum finnmarkense]